MKHAWMRWYELQVKHPERSDSNLANANLTMHYFNQLHISDYEDAGYYDGDPISAKVFSYYEEGILK